MGNFQQMFEKRRFDSDWEYRELRRMLSEAISGGYVEQIAVMKPNRFLPTEAHLPMIYIKGQIDPPAQVLVVVLGENAANLQVKITEAVKSALPTNSYLDITESHLSDPNLPTIRATGTQLNLNRKSR